MPAKVRGLTRRKGEAVWQFDFQIRGHRFCGSTGCTARRDAEKWLEDFRARKKAELTQWTGAEPMTFGVAAARWFDERGQHRRDWKDVERFLEWLQAQVGETKRLTAIDDNLVARLVATRRAEGIKPATVNRSCLEPLRAVLTRAELWGQKVGRVEWAKHKLKEAPERIREIREEELATFFGALRADFHDVVRFLLAQGLRRAEACNLEWRDVDLDNAQILVRGKGDTLDRRPLSAQATQIVRAQVGRHKRYVFTYEVRHEWGGKKRTRVRMRPDTLSTAFWRARKAAGLNDADMRLHDLRHTLASRLLRATGNLRAVQLALGHTKITTSQRYAHMTEGDLRSALDAAATPALELPAVVPKRKRK